MSSLPLKARVAIRDCWENQDAPVQTAMRTLENLFGRAVLVQPDWPPLIAELDRFYPDGKDTLVAVVAGCVEAWAKSMTELLADTANEAWTEVVLDRVDTRMAAFVEVAAEAERKAGTAWSEARGGFVITLPRTRVTHPAELFPVFKGELLACFDVMGTEVSHLPKTAEAGAGLDEDWADVSVSKTAGTPGAIKDRNSQPPASVAPPRVDYLPAVASLPRPDQLFLQPPYHLTMTIGHQQIELQCSHSPTLQVIAEYFKRWCRVNHADTRNPPAVAVTLHQSAFGLGEMFDRLILSTEETRYTNQFQVTSPLVVAFIEGVLGYQVVSSTQGTWSFRRDAQFKRL